MPYTAGQMDLDDIMPVREDRQEDLLHYTYVRYREEAASLGGEHRGHGDERKNRWDPVMDESAAHSTEYTNHSTATSKPDFMRHILNSNFPETDILKENFIVSPKLKKEQ